MGFIDQKQLEQYCHEGRFKRLATVVTATSIFHEATSSVLVKIIEPKSGEDLGICSVADIPGALQSFADSIDKDNDHHKIRNPNLIQLIKAFERSHSFYDQAQICLKQEEKRAIRKRFSVVGREPA